MSKICHINDLSLYINKEISERHGRAKELSVDILPSIDYKLYGLNKKKLIIVAGRVSMGKSALLMNLAWSFAKQDKKIMFFNLETTNMEFGERLFSYISSMDNYQIKSGKIIEDAKYATKIGEFQNVTEKTKLFVAESYGKTFPEIVKVIEKTGDDYDVVFIDYLQKIKMSGKNERTIMDEYLNQLADLAIEKDICIVLGSQINRGTYDGKKVEPPMLHELKGSGGIEEKAHQVWLIHWGYWYDNSKPKNEYRIHIAKNKDGRTGVTRATFYPEYYKICEEIDWEARETGTNKNNSTDYFNN